MTQLSVIVSVLDSHEVVRRQLLHLVRILPSTCELVLIDDGSDPPLSGVWNSVPKPFACTLHCTHDYRPWTQPRARNIGAAMARADKLLFFDIDHILSQELLEAALRFTGDKLHWPRRPAILDEQGAVVTDRQILREHGLVEETVSVHGNSFVIRRELFELLGGYDERFCGRYGGDDIDFNARYEALCRQGLAQPEEMASVEGYVFPDPARDHKGLFHKLPRDDIQIADLIHRRNMRHHHAICRHHL